jgi:hypothetical protein
VLHSFPGHRHRERARDVALSSRLGPGILYSNILMGDLLSFLIICGRTPLDDESRFLLGAPHLFTPAVTSDRLDQRKVPVFSFLLSSSIIMVLQPTRQSARIRSASYRPRTTWRLPEIVSVSPQIHVILSMKLRWDK